jgi:hypothetical protein
MMYIITIQFSKKVWPGLAAVVFTTEEAGIYFIDFDRGNLQ